MPLSIDIAFKWGKKKPEEEKKEEPPTASTTTCSTATTTDGTAITADTSKSTTEVSTKFKTLETGEKSKSLSKTAETEGDPSVTGNTIETKKTQTETIQTAADNSSKTGVAIDTVDDSEDDGTSCETATSSTNRTSSLSTDSTAASETLEIQPTQKNTTITAGFSDGTQLETAMTQLESLPTEYESVKTGDGEDIKAHDLEPEETQIDSASSSTDAKKKAATKKPAEKSKPKPLTVEKSKDKSSAIETSSTAESSETEATTATTQSESVNEDISKQKPGTSQKTKVVEPVATGNEKTQLSRRVIFFRHAERIDRVFPSWTRQACVNGLYRPYNSNHPPKLPKRRGGLAAYENDPPITEIGKIIAQLAGKSIRRYQSKIAAVFSSPSLRCIETAEILIKEIGASDLRIRIEPGLFDWYNFYEIAPNFMSTMELIDAGIHVAKGYRPIVTKEQLMKDFNNETKYDYYRRAQDVIQKILATTIGTVIIVGHAATIDASARPLLDLPKSIPTDRYLDRLADRYPYCTSVVIDQTQETGQWRLGKPLLPITFLNQSTKYDKAFMLRK